MSPFVDRLAHASIDVFFVGLLVFAVCIVLRPKSARLRSLLWLLVPAKGLASLLCGSALTLGSPLVESAADVVSLSPGTAHNARAFQPTTPLESHGASLDVAQSPVTNGSPRVATTPLVRPSAVRPDSRPSMSSWLTALWALGAAIVALASLRDRIRCARLLARSNRAPQGWATVVARCSAEMGVRQPRLRLTGQLMSPALIGTFQPTIAIPHWMADEESNEEAVEWAVRHELMHVAMRDPWAALVRELAQIALFFHPAVWIAGRKWEENAELACDRALVQNEDESLDYATRLHELASRVCRRPDPHVVLGLAAARSRVGRRIEALAGQPVGAARVTRGTAVAVSALFAATLTSGAGRLEPQPVEHDFQFSGRVVSPDGEPVAGAGVVLNIIRRSDWRAIELALTTTGDDGSFSIGYDRSDLPYEANGSETWKRVSLSAHAPGPDPEFGPGWHAHGDLEELSGLTIQLVPDYAVRGRFVDEDGVPLQGVEVRVDSLSAARAEQTDDWQSKAIAAASGGASSESSLTSIRVPSRFASTAITDEDGAFVLKGIGPDRLPWLSYRGGGAAIGNVRMVSREDDAQLLANAIQGSRQPVQASGSVISVARSRPIEGIVVDAATGKPMAGVDIHSFAIGRMIDVQRRLRTTTSADGRFVLDGMRKGKGNVILAIPTDEMPYFMREIEVPDTDGMAPIELEVKLHRGVWITGRAVDGETGEPVRGHVRYHPYLFNPRVLGVDQFKDRSTDGFEDRYRTGPDGSFRLVGLHGKGLVGIEAYGRYRSGTGYELEWDVDDGDDDEEMMPGLSPFLSNGPFAPGPDWPHSVAMLDIDPSAESVDVELTLDPGAVETVDLVDIEGRPFTEFNVKRSGWINDGVDKAGDSSIVVRGLGPNEARLVSIRGERGDVGILARIAASESRRSTLIVRPNATLVGRLIDEDGVPLAERGLSLYALPEEVPTGLHVSTDGEGKFALEGVAPGTDYRLYTSSGQFFVTVAESFGVEPGETVDFGTCVIKRP